MMTPLVELLTPKQSSLDVESGLKVFGERYAAIVACDCVVSIPDNPLGHLRFTALEVLAYLNAVIKPEQVLIHLNTFHRKTDLDALLEQAAGMGVRRLLCVSGDGGSGLTKLEPDALGFSGNTVTSIELLRYINARYPNAFTCGVAFNPYEPLEHEMDKLRRKINAGAQFVVTQPVMEDDANVHALLDCHLPIWVGAWMSKRIDLLYQCIGREGVVDNKAFDPYFVLRLIRTFYPTFGIYLSMIDFKQDWCGLVREIK